MELEPPNAVDFTKYIIQNTESTYIDSKEASSWDNGANSAKIAKDIAAFANSRDGGLIIIGKKELGANRFDLTGVTEDQANTFDTTKVATWINNRFSPPIQLECHRVPHDSKDFIVIQVKEFADIPVLCIKDFDPDGDTKKRLLKCGMIYVRGSNAESRPLTSVEELRQLIGIATSKRGDELLELMSNAMKGFPFAASTKEPQDADRITDEIKNISVGFPEVSKPSGWRVIVYPQKYHPERWENNTELEAVIRRRSISRGHTFPPYHTQTHDRQWGIANTVYGKPWTLSRSGLFLARIPFYEDDNSFPPSNLVGPQHREKGTWIDFQPNLQHIICFYEFILRYVHEFAPSEVVSWSVQASSLGGRELETTSQHISVHSNGECQETDFDYSSSMSVVEYRSEWKVSCRKTLDRFFRLFPQIGEIPPKVWDDWIDRVTENTGYV